jgi:urease accessory protein
LVYSAGFIAATALLHALGIGLGISIQRRARPQIVRFAGAEITLCGGYLLLS